MKPITISEDDLRSLLADKHHLETQITELQTKNTELLNNLRKLVAEVKAPKEEPSKKQKVDVLKKADLCVKVVSLIMSTSRDDQLLEDLAVQLMDLSEDRLSKMYGLLTMESDFPIYDPNDFPDYSSGAVKNVTKKMNYIPTPDDDGIDTCFPDYSERRNGR